MPDVSHSCRRAGKQIHWCRPYFWKKCTGRGGPLCLLERSARTRSDCCCAATQRKCRVRPCAGERGSQSPDHDCRVLGLSMPLLQEEREHSARTPHQVQRPGKARLPRHFGFWRGTGIALPGLSRYCLTATAPSRTAAHKMAIFVASSTLRPDLSQVLL